jgi:hypothetical protein
MNEQIEQLRALVEWQGRQDYTTTRGKTKQILTGIPRDKFWKVWNASKDSLKRLGLTVKMAGKSGTGETYIRDGVNRERIKKQWEILLWINPHNAHLAESLDCGPSNPF